MTLMGLTPLITVLQHCSEKTKHTIYSTNWTIETGSVLEDCMWPNVDMLRLTPRGVFHPLRSLISRWGHIPWRPQRRSLNQSSHRRSRRCGPDWTRHSSGLGTKMGESGWAHGYYGVVAHLDRRDPPLDRRSSTQRGSPYCWRTTTLQLFRSLPQGNPNVC